MYVSREERNGLTKEYLNEILEYRDGKLYWKVAISKKAVVGELAGGNSTSKGYHLIGINRKRYKLHRIIFLMQHGYLAVVIDHKDGNRSNNRIGNLRAATVAQNNRNSRRRGDGASSVKGVCFDSSRNKWLVHLCLDGKFKNFGRYDDLELAELVAIEAREKYHGEFARHS